MTIREIGQNAAMSTAALFLSFLKWEKHIFPHLSSTLKWEWPIRMEFPSNIPKCPSPKQPEIICETEQKEEEIMVHLSSSIRPS